MQRGDLDDALPLRYLWWWEGVLAAPPRSTRWGSHSPRRTRRPTSWTIHPHIEALVVDVAARRGVRCDLVTAKQSSHRWLTDIDDVIHERQLPFTGHTRCVDPDALDRTLSYGAGLSVVGVIHPYTDRPMLFGSKGIVVSNPEALQL